MIRASRRGALAGALALPAAAAWAKPLPRAAAGIVVLYDPSLSGARNFAAWAKAQGGRSLPIEGDRVRFARAVFERSPALVVGLSRSADFVLIEDVAREAGYVKVAAPPSLAGMLARTPASGWALAPRR